jgi:hypothetical protein
MGSRFGLGVPIGENVRERRDFGDPTPIALRATWNGECTVSR